jgi:ribosomal protein L37AE/L43A
MEDILHICGPGKPFYNWLRMTLLLWGQNDFPCSRYSDALLAINTAKAMELMEFDTKDQGAYIYFECPQCSEKAAIKCYSDKKNIWYCPKCKSSGHIISLYMAHAGKDYAEACEELTAKTALSLKPIEKELEWEYDLRYDKFIEEEFQLKEHICQKMGIGSPKGR